MAGLYIHIPFCRSKCIYCDFYSLPMRIEASDYIDALLLEFKARREEIPEPFRTVYIGGGTPSVLPLSGIIRLLSSLSLDWSGVEEATVEANPEDITAEWCAAVQQAGITRVSLGVQSFIDTELKSVGRRHSAADALNAVKTLQDAGIRDISIDLIYGLPGQTLDSWRISLDTAWKTGANHLSAYTLTYEPGTRLYARRQAGKVIETGDDTIVSMYRDLTAEASRHGFIHYEISNFARTGHEARHNSAYWKGVPYLGIGAAAHSYDGCVRRWNPRSLSAYMADPVSSCERECLDANAVHNDMVMTGLRTARGIDLTLLDESELRMVRRYVDRGMMSLLADDRVRIAERHWLVADSIIADLFRVD